MGVLAGTPGGQLRVEMRAGVPDDVIRAGIFDERKTPGPLTIRVEYPGTKEGRGLGTFGQHNRLIGRIEHPANTLDAEDLYFYLSRLAIECDPLQSLLTGNNIF